MYLTRKSPRLGLLGVFGTPQIANCDFFIPGDVLHMWGEKENARGLEEDLSNEGMHQGFMDFRGSEQGGWTSGLDDYKCLRLIIGRMIRDLRIPMDPVE